MITSVQERGKPQNHKSVCVCLPGVIPLPFKSKINLLEQEHYKSILVFLSWASVTQGYKPVTDPMVATNC